MTSLINTAKNGYFVVLNQTENELLESASQQAVYLAVKSYCKNGNSQRALSVREIASRSKISKSSIPSIIKNLIQLNLIEIVGEDKRIGGKVPIYNCPIAGQLNALRKGKSVLNNNESVQIQTKSVQQLASNKDQYNKVNKGESENTLTQNFSNEKLDDKLYEIAKKYHVTFFEVQDLFQRMKLYYESNGKLLKNEIARLEKWLVEEINAGKITSHSPIDSNSPKTEYVILEDNENKKYHFGTMCDNYFNWQKPNKIYDEQGNPLGYAFTEREYLKLQELNNNNDLFITFPYNDSYDPNTNYYDSLESKFSEWIKNGKWDLYKEKKVVILSADNMLIHRYDD